MIKNAVQFKKIVPYGLGSYHNRGQMRCQFCESMASVNTRGQKSSPFYLTPICLGSKTEAE